MRHARPAAERRPRRSRGRSRGRTSRTRTRRCRGTGRSRACDRARRRSRARAPGRSDGSRSSSSPSSMRPMPMIRRFCERVLHREEARVEAGLVAERIEAAEVDASRALLERPRQVPAVDLGEVRRSRRSGCRRRTCTSACRRARRCTPAPSRSSPFGQGIVRVIFVRREVVLHERRRPDLPAVGLERVVLDDAGSGTCPADRAAGPRCASSSCPRLSVNVSSDVALHAIDDLDLLVGGVVHVEARTVVGRACSVDRECRS